MDCTRRRWRRCKRSTATEWQNDAVFIKDFDKITGKNGMFTGKNLDFERLDWDMGLIRGEEPSKMVV
jgi:hypothetical protein